MKNLLIFCHSYFPESRVNKILLELVRKNFDRNTIQIRNLDDMYGSDYLKIDIQAEQKCLMEAEKIFFQFPVFWFSVPPMLKGYIDQVFTRYWAYDEGGDKLKGKKFQIVATAGMRHESYQKDGKMGATIDEVLLPLKLTAKLTCMDYQKPFIINRSRRILEEEIRAYYKDYLSLFA